MNALSTISYADRRALVNGMRELRRHPGRAVMWLCYLVALVGFAALKTSPHSARARFAHSVWAGALNDLIVCGLAIAFGVVLATGTERWLGFFSSRAEALLLTRGTPAPVLVAAYLQVRAILRTLAGALSRLAYVFILGLPAGTTAHALLLQLTFFGAAAAAIASVTLPRALARGGVRLAMIALGSAIALIAALPLVVDGLRLFHPAGIAALRDVDLPHPGVVMTALSAGDVRAIAPPLLVAAIATAAFALAARDAYPELYTISLANFDFREKLRSRRNRSAETAAPAAREVTTTRSVRGTWWPGALAFLRVDALMFSRRVSPALTGLFAALALAGGALLALLARRSPELFFGVAIGTFPGLSVAVTSTIGVRLAPALRLPMFWLGDVPLAARLAAWTFGAVWRDAVLIALAVIGFVAVAHDPRGPALGFVGALGFVALTRSVGLGVFALLPNSLDQRGPAVLLRTLLSFALLAPPVAAGFVAALVLGRPSLLAAAVAGTAAGTFVALAEATALVAFAAWRLAGRVDRLSAA